jgi:hypothetical protein
MSQETSGGVTFFEGFDGALRRLISGACDLAGRKGIAPDDFTAALVTSLVGRAFDVAETLVGADKAVEMISAHARGARSDLQFGEHVGEV